MSRARRILTIVPTPASTRPQDLAITLMGVYMRADGTAWSGGLVELLGEFGFSPGAARMALGRLARRRLLDRVRVGRTIHYTLTNRSRQLLAEGDERIFSLGSDETDGETWTILWHTLPDN